MINKKKRIIIMILDSFVLKYYAERRIKIYRFLHYNTIRQNKSIKTLDNHTFRIQQISRIGSATCTQKTHWLSFETFVGESDEDQFLATTMNCFHLPCRSWCVCSTSTGLTTCVTWPARLTHGESLTR